MAYENMYFETVSKVLALAITDYCQDKGITAQKVDLEIAQHIKNTADQHKNPDPDIDYQDALCRLGYLYVHVGANARIFEDTISQSPMLSHFIQSNSGQSISICAVGGGPGTELLGLAKYLLLQRRIPSDISFTILDSVPQWAETWGYLSDVVQEIFKNELNTSPVIHRTFQPMDVTDPTNYTDYPSMFRRLNLVVYNYLLSENQVRLENFSAALVDTVRRVPSGCIFAFIDRLEYDTVSQFSRTDVRSLINTSGLQILEEGELAGVVTDSESVLDEYRQRFSQRRPRRWYRTPNGRRPTVFTIIAQKR